MEFLLLLQIFNGIFLKFLHFFTLSHGSIKLIFIYTTVNASVEVE